MVEREAPKPKPQPLFAAGVTVTEPISGGNRPKLCKDLKGLFTPCPKSSAPRD